MKTRKLIDLYLPPKWGYHARIFLASVIFAISVNIINNNGIMDQGSVIMFILLFIQLEFFLWLGTVFFARMAYSTINEYVKKSIGRLILFFGLAFVISTIFYVSVMVIVALINGQDLQQLFADMIKYEAKGFLIGTGSGYLIGTLIFFYFQWIDALKREQKLKEEKLIFQYETLKNQVNPHFLFNSLNTLSSLVSKDPEQSEEYIQKLSAIYRYILENKDHDHINLKKEMDFVKDYFFLQKVRDDGKIELDIDVPGPERYEILPISLQMLVENAFKHNMASREDPLRISIRLLENENAISVENNMRPKTIIEDSSGLGLANLSARNKLVSGREVQILTSEDAFTVLIPLKQHQHESSDH